MQINTTNDLRQVLIDTIGDIRAGAIDARDASAIGTLAGKILQSAKLDMDCARFQREMSGSPGNPGLPAPKPLQLVAAQQEIPSSRTPRVKQAV